MFRCFWHQPCDVPAGCCDAESNGDRDDYGVGDADGQFHAAKCCDVGANVVVVVVVLLSLGIMLEPIV